MLLRFLLTILSFSHCYGAEGGRTFLIAAHLGDVAKMRYLLDHEGVDINFIDENSWSALHYAAYGSREGAEHIEAVEFLLTRGINTMLITRGGRKLPLHFAITNGSGRIFEMLVAGKGFNLWALDSYGNTLLHYAVRSQRFGAAEFFLNRAAAQGLEFKLANTPNRHGRTPLHHAAMVGNVWLMSALLSHGARPDWIDVDGYSSEDYYTFAMQQMGRGNTVFGHGYLNKR